jgi:uncharacterized metal-binding protein
MKTTALIATLVALFAASANAQTPSMATPHIDKVQTNQQTRINQGVASGALTPTETAQLTQQQTRIATDKAHAQADGVVTKAERKHLRHEQRHASRNIFRKKHNGRHAH